MVKEASVGRRKVRPKRLSGSSYDYALTVINMARKSGWDIETLGLIPKDLPVTPAGILSRKQVAERNRLVKSIFQRFSSILTPPIPSDLERSIRSKAPDQWLPWEKEAIEKIAQWRDEIEKVRPEILNELSCVLRMRTEGSA